MGLGIDQADPESFLGENVGDAITHGTGADHRDILHMAFFIPRKGLVRGLVIIAEVTSFPGLDEICPGEGIEDILRRGLALVIVLLSALS